VAQAATKWAVSREVFYLGFETLTPWSDHKPIIGGAFVQPLKPLSKLCSTISDRTLSVSSSYAIIGGAFGIIEGAFLDYRGCFADLSGVLLAIIGGAL
jgi:hypothetical protein